MSKKTLEQQKHEFDIKLSFMYGLITGASFMWLIVGPR